MTRARQPLSRPSHLVRLGVVVLTSCLVATAATACGAGAGSQARPSTAGVSSSPTLTPTPSASTSVVTPTPTTTPTATSTPEVSSAAARATIAKAMLGKGDLHVLQLAQSNDTPVGGPSQWSVTCGVTLRTDTAMIATGYQEWTRGTQVIALETLARYRRGQAGRALAEATRAARSCTSYTFQKVSMRRVEVVSATASTLVVCEQTPNNEACFRAGVHGDHIEQVLVFGASRASALRDTQLVAGMAAARLEAAGL